MTIPPMQTHTDDILTKLDALRTELAELAFTLDRRGRPDAADVAISTSNRVGKLRDEIAEANVTCGELSDGATAG